jgi:N-acetylglucosaminyldiphosphoundecaprenol N-acetyl-beta-D-mannosaminyltransferase
MNKQELIDSPISLESYNQFIDTIIDDSTTGTSKYVCVANVHMLVEAHWDRSFSKIVTDADMVTPDGKPLTWALRLLYGIKQERVAGMELLPDLLRPAAKAKLPVYFYGSNQYMLDATARYIAGNFPELRIAGMYSPPFRSLTGEEEIEIVQKINQSGARLVFVVLGCPKQEKWMASMKGRINAVMVGIGGALPVMIGMQKRAPHWMQKTGLEWFFRFCQEPRRLFKRYLVTNSLFIFLLTWEFIRIKSRKYVFRQIAVQQNPLSN